MRKRHQAERNSHPSNVPPVQTTVDQETDHQKRYEPR